MQDEAPLTWDHLYFQVENTQGKKVFQSNVERIEDNVCTWHEQDGLILRRASQNDNHTFHFRFYMAPCFRSTQFGSIFWFCKGVKSTSFMSGSDGARDCLCERRKSMATSGFIEQYAFDMRFSLRITYHSDIRSDEYLIANYYLSALEVRLKPTIFGVMKHIQDEQMHKIVCVAGKKIFMGRAQNIETEYLARTYTWYTKESTEAFPGIAVKTESFWDNHVDQHRDMQRIRLFNEPLSARLSVMQHAQPYMPDNDWYHNDMHVAPMMVEMGHEFPIQFWNMGTDESVKSIATSIEWEAFKVSKVPAKTAMPLSPRILGRKKSSPLVSDKPLHVTRQLTSGLTVDVGYVIVSGKVWIKSIALRASHYIFDLRF